MSYEDVYRAARNGNLHVAADGTYTVGNKLPIPPANAALIANMIAWGDLVIVGTQIEMAR
jgi:hypothetical protein